MSKIQLVRGNILLDCFVAARSNEQMHTVIRRELQPVFEKMTLRLAHQHFPVRTRPDFDLAFQSVLGICGLGLHEKSGDDIETALQVLLTQSPVDLFRDGWAHIVRVVEAERQCFVLDEQLFGSGERHRPSFAPKLKAIFGTIDRSSSDRARVDKELERATRELLDLRSLKLAVEKGMVNLDDQVRAHQNSAEQGRWIGALFCAHIYMGGKTIEYHDTKDLQKKIYSVADLDAFITIGRSSLLRSIAGSRYEGRVLRKVLSEIEAEIRTNDRRDNREMIGHVCLRCLIDSTENRRIAEALANQPSELRFSLDQLRLYLEDYLELKKPRFKNTENFEKLGAVIADFIDELGSDVGYRDDMDDEEIEATAVSLLEAAAPGYTVKTRAEILRFLAFVKNQGGKKQ